MSGVFQSGVNLFTKRRQPQPVVEDTPTPDTQQQETIEPTADETSGEESEEGATSSEAPAAGFFSKWFAKKTPPTEKQGDEGGALEQPQTKTAADEPVMTIATAQEETSPKGATEGSEGEEEDTSAAARPAVLNHAIVPPPLKTSLEASLEDGELAAAELWKCCALGGKLVEQVGRE